MRKTLRFFSSSISLQNIKWKTDLTRKAEDLNTYMVWFGGYLVQPRTLKIASALSRGFLNLETRFAALKNLRWSKFVFFLFFWSLPFKILASLKRESILHFHFKNFSYQHFPPNFGNDGFFKSTKLWYTFSTYGTSIRITLKEVHIDHDEHKDVTEHNKVRFSVENLVVTGACTEFSSII